MGVVSVIQPCAGHGLLTYRRGVLRLECRNPASGDVVERFAVGLMSHRSW
jgi:hypothetical protein